MYPVYYSLGFIPKTGTFPSPTEGTHLSAHTLSVFSQEKISPESAFNPEVWLYLCVQQKTATNLRQINANQNTQQSE